MESIMIGSEVTFSYQKDKPMTGIIVDKINMKDKATDNFTVTGYLIQHDGNKIKPFAYWRIESFKEEQEEHAKEENFNKA